QTARLVKRAAFGEPAEVSDDIGLGDADGQVVHGYPIAFRTRANLLPLRGGESVMHARLAAKNPAILTVRNSALTRRVTSDWKVLIDGRVFDCKEDPRESQDRRYLEILVEASP
ncbi:head-tail adaptor protein, partial [Paracoccus denitrificans]